MQILKYKKIFFTLSTVLVILSIVATAIFGLKLGIDFTGGSVLEISQQPTANSQQLTDEDFIKEKLIGFDLGELSVRPTDNAYILRTKVLSEETKNQIVSALGDVEVIRFNTIGPTLGDELKSKALVALLIVIVAIVFFVAYSFRHVSTPVSSWKYGFVTIIALLHDVMITVGIFSLLGYFAGVEIDALFITALLVILGYSINDTIVVFDRVRDNLGQIGEKNRAFKFNEVLNKSFKQTITRSVNTSLTTLIALFAIFFVGTETIRDFILALIIGVIAGTYSSIFLAIPLLSVFNKNK
jgi:preprotein translocase subunit SecF